MSTKQPDLITRTEVAKMLSHHIITPLEAGSLTAVAVEQEIRDGKHAGQLPKITTTKRLALEAGLRCLAGPYTSAEAGMLDRVLKDLRERRKHWEICQASNPPRAVEVWTK